MSIDAIADTFFLCLYHQTFLPIHGIHDCIVCQLSTYRCKCCALLYIGALSVVVRKHPSGRLPCLGAVLVFTISISYFSLLDIPFDVLKSPTFTCLLSVENLQRHAYAGGSSQCRFYRTWRGNTAKEYLRARSSPPCIRLRSYLHRTTWRVSLSLLSRTRVYPDSYLDHSVE